MIWTLDSAVADDGGIIGDGPKGRRRPRRDLLSFPSDLTSVAIVNVSLVLRPLPIKARFWALQRRCPTRVCNTNCWVNLNYCTYVQLQFWLTLTLWFRIVPLFRCGFRNILWQDSQEYCLEVAFFVDLTMRTWAVEETCEIFRLFNI